NPPQYAVHPSGTFATGCALAARLRVVEPRDPLEHAHHARGLVHHDHCAGTEGRTDLAQAVVIHRHIHHHIARNDRHRRASRNDCLELASLTHTAAYLEQVLEWNPKRQLDVLRFVHVSGHREDERATSIRHTKVREPLRTLTHDRRHGCISLGVVDRARPTIQAVVGRKRRLETRPTLFALERLEQRSLLTTDISACANERV